MIKITKGSDRDIIIRLTSNGDPFDLTNAEYISACFTDEDDSSIHREMLSLVGDILNGSDMVSGLNTSSITEGMIVVGTGIPSETKVLRTPSSASPTPAGQIQLSNAATTTLTGETFKIGNISILNSPLVGKIKVSMDEAFTDQLKSGEGMNFEVKVIRQGYTSICQFTEILNVVESYCAS